MEAAASGSQLMLYPLAHLEGPMENSLPDVWLEHDERVPNEWLADFVGAIDVEGLRVETRSRQGEPVFAGVEWIIPTGIVLYILKSDFDGFLNEAGKAHYLALSKAAAKLGERMRGQTGLVRRGREPQGSGLYSLDLSAIARSQEGWTFKLLLQSSLDETGVERAIVAFLEFMDVLHAGELDERVLVELKAIQHVGSTVFLAYDFDSGQLTVLDPIPPDVRRRGGA